MGSQPLVEGFGERFGIDAGDEVVDRVVAVQLLALVLTSSKPCRTRS